MAKKEKDKVAKTLVAEFGDSLLHLAGVSGFTSWKSVHSELVAPHRLPDGMIEAQFADEEKPRLYLVEVESYADNSVDPQLFEDIMLTRLEKGVVPEVICVVLKEKGNLTVQGTRREQSASGQVELGGRWPVTEVWKFEMEELLSRQEAGLIPMAALARFDGTMEQRIRRCEEEILRTTTPEDRRRIVFATAVMLQHFFGGASLELLLEDRSLFNIPGLHESAMVLLGPAIEERFAARLEEEVAARLEEEVAARLEEEVAARLEEEVADYARQAIIDLLSIRFGTVPESIRVSLGRIGDLGRLRELNRIAVNYPDLTTFETDLSPRTEAPKTEG